MECLNTHQGLNYKICRTTLAARRLLFLNGKKSFTCSNSSDKSNLSTIKETVQTGRTYEVLFNTLGSCKLGISIYPDFEYNAQGGVGTGKGTQVSSAETELVSVDFDVEKLYIPPLSTNTTKFLGIPLPPFLKIEIFPDAFRGEIDTESGQVVLEFIARFCFSVGSLYKAPALLVKTVLTSEESEGTMRGGKGQRLNSKKGGICMLVGVATIEPTGDLFMDTFLRLPTECLAVLNASISLSPTQ